MSMTIMIIMNIVVIGESQYLAGKEEPESSPTALSSTPEPDAAARAAPPPEEAQRLRCESSSHPRL